MKSEKTSTNNKKYFAPITDQYKKNQIIEKIFNDLIEQVVYKP